MARILIAGAGKLGRPLAGTLVQDGHQVSAIRRGDPGDHGDGIRWFRLDLEDPEAFKSLDAAYDQVIIILTPAARSAEGYARIYQQALGNLLRHLEGYPPRPACLFVSATSVYAQNDGAWVDEDSLTAPITYNGRSLLEAEDTVRRWSPNPLVVRFAGIYGPERTRLLRQLEQPQRIQRTPPLYTNRVHQDDCVSILWFLAELQRTRRNRHPVYIGADHCPAPRYEMMSWLAREAGLVPPIPVDAPDGSPANKRCSNRRLLEAGYRFIHPDYESGYRALLETGPGPARSADSCR